MIWWRVVPAHQGKLDPVGEFENGSPAEPSAWSDTHRGEPAMATQRSVYERLMGGNRKPRKDLQRRLCSEDPGLGVVHANAAGIDRCAASSTTGSPARPTCAPEGFWCGVAAEFFSSARGDT